MEENSAVVPPAVKPRAPRQPNKKTREALMAEYRRGFSAGHDEGRSGGGLIVALMLAIGATAGAIVARLF